MTPRRRRYLVGAVCVALCTVMLLPLLASVLASVKPTAEAAETPPTYFPHGFSLDAYRRLWEYQDGLPTYLINSLGTALLTVVFTRRSSRRSPATGWLASRSRSRSRCSSCCCSP